jgi:hypothetical protein
MGAIKPEPKSAPKPESPPAPDITPLLEKVIAKVSDLSANQLAQLEQLVALMERGVNKPARPCTLKVNRDGRGFIDSIEVTPT